MSEENVEPRIVAGVANMAGNGLLGPKGAIAQLYDKAMANAVQQAMDDGVSVYDIDEILKRKAEALVAVKAKIKAILEKQAAEIEAAAK